VAQRAPLRRAFFPVLATGLVASGYLAVAGSGYLDTPTIALTAAGLVLRGLVIRGFVRLDLPDRTVTSSPSLYRLLRARLFPSFAGVPHRHCPPGVFPGCDENPHGENQSGLSLHRRYCHCGASGCRLLSIDFNFFLFLALYLLFAIATLTSGEIRRSTGRAAATARSGLKRFYPRPGAAFGIDHSGICRSPPCCSFFCPRTAEAAFSRLISHRFYLPGFSSEVTLASSAKSRPPPGRSCTSAFSAAKRLAA